MSSPVTEIDLATANSRLGLSGSDVVCEAAFRLFDHCRGSVYRYVRSFGLDEGTSEDVVQDVALALVGHLAWHRENTNLKGWIFRVAHNLALKQRARERRRVRFAHLRVLVSSPIDPAPSIEDRLVAYARRGRLHAVLRALPERDRRCVVLRAEGLRYREIGCALGMSVAGVAKCLARALPRLQRADERRQPR